MARLNELLGAAQQWSKGIAAQFGLEEQEGVPTVAPELVPVSDIHARPEQWVLHGGTLLWGRSALSAVAGQFSQSAIEPGEGEVVIVEKLILAHPAVALTYRLGLSTVPLTSSTGNLVTRDVRSVVTAGGSARSGTRIRHQNSATLSDVASNTLEITLPATVQIVTIDINQVLIQPWSLRCMVIAQNEAMLVNWFVRARAGTPRELAVNQL